MGPGGGCRERGAGGPATGRGRRAAPACPPRSAPWCCACRARASRPLPPRSCRGAARVPRLPLPPGGFTPMNAGAVPGRPGATARGTKGARGGKLAPDCFPPPPAPPDMPPCRPTEVAGSRHLPAATSPPCPTSTSQLSTKQTRSLGRAGRGWGGLPRAVPRAQPLARSPEALLVPVPPAAAPRCCRRYGGAAAGLGAPAGHGVPSPQDAATLPLGQRRGGGASVPC